MNKKAELKTVVIILLVAAAIGVLIMIVVGGNLKELVGISDKCAYSCVEEAKCGPGDESFQGYADCQERKGRTFVCCIPS
tara:strand:+ start:1733 stop:1972 length:240 start_codon:yes stop_codon:yes gene_type:complete